MTAGTQKENQKNKSEIFDEQKVLNEHILTMK